VLRIVIAVAVAVVMAYTAWQRQQNAVPKQLGPESKAATAVNPRRPEEPSPAAPEREPTPKRTEAAQPNSAAAAKTPTPRTTILDQAIYDQLGNEVYRGDIDLRPTLDRIRDGRKLSFANDGSIFQNRERRLPRQPEGYYREYVHPTPGLSGPGPQRIVVGEKGDAWYTPDHYRTFRQVAVE
jgi:guanyl-specific ribonuclease Sa